MNRAKQEAMRNMKLDASFFQQMLRHDSDVSEEAKDFDIYLMETSVMPLLMQGLDALARHVDKISGNGENCIGGSSQMPFNPLVWLAQFLLRNHPLHVKDHRQAMYQQFAELASIQRGRRCLLRRRAQFEEAWKTMERESDAPQLILSDIARLVRRMDEAWGLNGLFVERMPRDYRADIKLPEGHEDALLFVDFWHWFEDHVTNNDVLRETAFTDAERRRKEQELQSRKAEEDVQHRERAMQEALEYRSMLEEQFDTLSADMYINDEITYILSKGAVIQGVEEKEGGPPLQGEHVQLLLAMLELWGCKVSTQEEEGEDDHNTETPILEDSWDDAALSAWTRWLEARGLETNNPCVDAVTLRILMNRTRFQEYLAIAFPLEDNDEECGVYHMVEVKGFVEDDEIMVEVLNEETGQLMQLVLPEQEAEEVAKRLQRGTAPIHARADVIDGRILEVIPEVLNKNRD
eukprot:TRINITY_DN69449_c0_g1_i1.p1 TRINITY_DN69449_c0_g1~~TRINITY_DN69449_c0_g1_i1.p1  ORF type:complete len:463 (-),score=111.75 TRINITY_DN69449_c0_g1_i1:62-1450(-)